MYLSKKQRRLYDLLSWPDWKPGRQLAQEYKVMYQTSISFGSLYTAMRRLVEENLAEYDDGKDKDGRVRSYRRKATGSRISPVEDKTTIDDLVGLPA